MKSEKLPSQEVIGVVGWVKWDFSTGDHCLGDACDQMVKLRGFETTFIHLKTVTKLPCLTRWELERVPNAHTYAYMHL